MIVVHFSGSWHSQPGCKSLKEEIEACGYRIACDWLSDKHQSRPEWPEQYDAVAKAIEVADVLFLSFDGMEDRASSATFAQFHMAMALKKQIIVYDPAKETREFRDRQGVPVHPAFGHLMGKPLYNSQRVLWLSDKTKALEAIAPHAHFSIQVGGDAAALS